MPDALAIALTLIALFTTIALQTRPWISRRMKIATAAGGLVLAVIGTFVLYRAGAGWAFGFPFAAARIELKAGGVTSSVLASAETLSYSVSNFALAVGLVHGASLLVLRAIGSRGR